MPYRDNVTKLASTMMLTNDPGLEEEDLIIASLRFFSTDGTETTITASNMNRGGRLFIQYQVLISEDSTLLDAVLPCDELLRRQAADYFAELWEENPEPGKRPLLDALRQYEFVAITYKWENK